MPSSILHKGGESLEGKITDEAQNAINSLTGKSETKAKTPADEESRRKTLEEKTSILYGAAIASAGGGYPDDTAYYRAYNSLHRLDYFNPNVTGNLHVFVTRPNLFLAPQNLKMSTKFMQACLTEEGCLVLGSLCRPGFDPSEITAKANKGDRPLRNRVPIPTWVEDTVDGEIVGGHFDWNNKSAGDAPMDWDNPFFTMGATPSNNDAAAAANNLHRWGTMQGTGYGNSGYGGVGATPFIPLLSNLTTSIQGIKDIGIDSYEYDGDMAGHKTFDASGYTDSKMGGEVTLTCYETANMGVTSLIDFWTLYIDLVTKGIMNAGIEESIKPCIYDYMCSIYWFVTGMDGYTIKLYGRLTGAWPVNIPISSLIPSKRGSSVDPEISIPFKYNHPEVNNPEILNDFNWLVDRAIYSLGNQKGALTPGPRVLNSKVRAWKEKYYDDKNGVSTVQLKDTTELYGRGKYDNGNPVVGEYKYHPTSKTYRNGSSEPGAQFRILMPNEMNAWFGHPYILNGHLVYRTLDGESTIASSYSGSDPSKRQKRISPEYRFGL